MTDKKTIDISLKYSGPDVSDGTMLIDDMAPVLQGFSSAYGKIVTYKNLPYQHKIRIVGVSKGSFDIALQVWDALGSNTDQLQALEVAAGGVVGVVTIIFQIINLIKHVKKEPYKSKPGNSNTVIVVNNQQAEMEIPLEVFSLFQEKTISADLGRIARPIEEEKIDSLQFSAVLPNKTLDTTISLSEKPYFEIETEEIAKTQEMEIIGKFLSLWKTTNKGRFLLANGRQVAYELPKENPESYYNFFIDNGSMKVKCIAHFDANLEPTRIEILSIERLQQTLLGDT